MVQVSGGGLRAAIFDMDGVVTRTAHLHAAAWKQAFDEVLSLQAQDGSPYRPFDQDAEYRAYVDGKPRRDGGPRAAHDAPFGAYTDAAHHEYPSRIEEMVRRGLTDCAPEEFCCIEQVLLRCGDPAAVLLEQSRRQTGSVLVLGWNGVLDSGRALVFKKLLQETECALLIVRKTEQSSAHLKVGKEIDD